MKKKGFFKNLENFESEHRITFFLLIMFLTIGFVRTLVLIRNFNPSLFGFEFHHFDYGIIILIITLLFILFGKRRDAYYLFFSALGLGLIVDDIWFIRSNIIDPEIHETIIYNSTIFPSVIISIVVILVILLVHKSFRSRRK